MSSDDFTEIYRKPCICGSGEVIIEFCMPDHPWTTKSMWFKKSVTCSKCGSEYSLIEQDDKITLVRKSDVQKRETMKDEYLKRCNNILTWPETKEVLDLLETLLDNQPSIKACYRLLHDSGLTSESYSSFFKKWKGAAEWIEDNVKVYNLRKVLEMLHEHVPLIINELEQLEKLRKKHDEFIPYIGEYNLDISRYREW